MKNSAVDELDRLMVDHVEGLKKALPGMLREREEINNLLSEINQKINAVESVIRAFGKPDEKQQGELQRRIKVIPPRAAKVSVPARESPSGRAPQGQVYDDVAKVMKDGKQRGLSELQEEVKKISGIEYGVSSIYRALQDGKEKGHYRNENRGWAWVKK